MRVSEQSYPQDRRALDAAARLIDFEARTGTIRALTGLTDACIRSLSKAYGTNGDFGPRYRHRGAAPHSVTYLLDKAEFKNEAAALLGLCQLMDLTFEPTGFSPDRALDSIAHTERLCDVFWTFRYLMPEASIGFEHMLLLLSSAAQGEELAMAHCGDCNALLAVDPLSLYCTRCPHCVEAAPLRRRSADVVLCRRVAEESPAYL